MKIVTVVAALVVCSSVGACSGYGMRDGAAPEFAGVSKASPQHASVCVFRPHGLGTSVVATVSDNGAIVGATEGSSYFCYDAEPGQHQLRTADAAPVVVDAKAGQRYFFAHDLNVGRDELVRVSATTADQLVAYCEYRLLRSAPGNIPLPAEGAVARAVTSGSNASALAAATPRDNATKRPSSAGTDSQVASAPAAP